MNSNLADIIRRAREGDLEAFRQIHQEYGRRILNFVYRMVESREDAEDLTQDVFLKVYHELEKLQDHRRFESWIYRIARNEVYQSFRKRRSEPKNFESAESSKEREKPLREPADARPTPQDEILHDELGARIEKVLATLPPKLREVFVLAVMHEKSYAEIAEIVGRSLLSVKTDIFRARSLARKSLGQYLEVRR